MSSKQNNKNTYQHLTTVVAVRIVSPSSESSAMRSKQDIGRRSQLPLAPDIQLPCRMTGLRKVWLDVDGE